MKGRVSFEGIGEVMATFYAGEGVKGGQVVKLGGDGEVIPCGAGERFCGLAVSGSAGYAGVQVAGFAQVKCGDGGPGAGVSGGERGRRLCHRADVRKGGME